MKSFLKRKMGLVNLKFARRCVVDAPTKRDEYDRFRRLVCLVAYEVAAHYVPDELDKMDRMAIWMMCANLERSSGDVVLGPNGELP